MPKSLNHQGTITLESKRLLLRRFIIGDADAMFNNWANNPDVTKYLSWNPHGNIVITKTLLNSWVSEYNNPDYYHWVIVLKEINEPIGSISFVKTSDKHFSAEVGYCIGKAFWHQGYTTEALFLVLGYGFEAIGFNRIAARHDVLNPNSGKVMKKCGMTYEGTLREIMVNTKEEFCDLCLYSILKSEWFNRDSKDKGDVK